MLKLLIVLDGNPLYWITKKINNQTNEIPSQYVLNK